ncbi:MAG: DUF4974 domain-containing protein [Terrimonas sp.]|nr:DUF4974 domain-containing protein [Terrimonas sp.]
MKYLLNELPEVERASVRTWIDAHAENQRYFSAFQTIWENSRELAVVSGVDANAAWERFKERKNKNRPTRNLLAYRLRIAASVIIIAAIGIIGFMLIRNNPVEELVVASRQSPLTDTLSDGSIITLNKASSLSYPSKFKGKTRSVALKGEAFFNIKPDHQKPFIITVDSVQVTVVGTSFNIKNENGVTEVIVETGIVKVVKGGSTIALKAGEKITIGRNNESLTKEPVTDKLYNYYRSREFVCDDTPLWKLVEVLNQAYDSTILIARPELRRLRLNTTFINESLEQVLNVISLTFDVRITRKEDTIIIE